ncbi:PqqD family protein [Mycobacterium sp. TY815]|uniref:PqqD family protein n=1 Tax=unclassified Mycobacterium TaxID=2642494 RepID=UPI0027423C4C|nr:PqqD family protein [Mycobacterium sp. TY815]MDP7702116.1 PqqD family protein [Mycobacterium sp. TY815]
MSSHADTTFMRNNELQTDAADGGVVIQTAGGKYLVLMGSACSVWQCLDRWRSLDELVNELSGTYAGTEAIRVDISDVLAEWCRRGLVVRRGEGGR